MAADDLSNSFNFNSPKIQWRVGSVLYDIKDQHVIYRRFLIDNYPHHQDDPIKPLDIDLVVHYKRSWFVYSNSDFKLGTLYLTNIFYKNSYQKAKLNHVRKALAYSYLRNKLDSIFCKSSQGSVGYFDTQNLE